MLDPPIETPKPRTPHPATTVRHQTPPTSKPPKKASNPDSELYLIQSVNEAAPEVPVTGDPAETGVVAMEEGYRRELRPSDPEEANPNLREPSLIGWGIYVRTSSSPVPHTSQARKATGGAGNRQDEPDRRNSFSPLQ